MKNFNLKAMLLLAVLLCGVAPAFASEEITQDNMKYTLFDDGTAAVSGAERSITTANIPEKITYEGKDYTVTSIGNYAFYKCRGLTSVDIPSSVTSIGNGAFSWCTGLTSVNIPYSVTNIGEYAFQGCSSLFAYHYKKDGTATLLMAGYKSAEMSGRETYSIPEKVTHDGAEYTVTGIGDNAFYNCTGLASVDIPGSVTSIGDNAFFSCTGLASVDIPSSVTSIGNGAFSWCTGLASVDIPSSVTSIGDGTFLGCTGLASVDIPSSVTSIGDGTFLGCTGLASVDIPSSVTSIGQSAFRDCTGLASVVIPNSVTSIGRFAFVGCSSLFAYHYKKDGTATLLKAGYKSAEMSGRETYSIPEKVTHNGTEYSVTSIGDDAFEDCTGLASVDIPNSVKSIGDEAFWGCTGLTSVNIPNSVTSIGDWAFYNCSSLFAYHYKKDGTATLLKAGYKSAEMSGRETYSIPEKVTHNGTEYSVTSIGDNAFEGCTDLVSVNIPNSVTSIGMYAFRECGSLASVDIPNSVTSIGDYAFYKCTGLASVDIPNSVMSIGGYAFEGCIGLTSVNIPNSVTSIGIRAFYGCNSLKKLVCNATTPPVCRGEVFDGFVEYECTLYVPQESIDAYKSAAQWKDFFNIATGIKNVSNTSSSATESARYSTDGTRLASPQKGINIIRMSDGTVKKVLVK